MIEAQVSKNRISRKAASFTESVIREMTREAVKYGGIGLKNVQRRLDLIYPAQHKLEIKCEENFTVTLQLNLDVLQDQTSVPMLEEVVE